MKRTFRSVRAYWKFQQAVRRVNRYMRTQQEESFLKTVLTTSESRNTTIQRDKILWRAQLGHDWEAIEEYGEVVAEVPRQYPPKRMLPLPESASEGRANPKGIPYVYLATDRDTALAEVRPWVGSLISVGAFKTLRELKVVNCAVNKRPSTRIYLKEPPVHERELAVWADIDRAFSEPITPNDKIADYVPTQIIAELFKVAGFDGVAYNSAFGDGVNVVLFDLASVGLLKCSLYEAKSLRFQFEETTNPYYIREADSSGETEGSA